MADRGRAVWIYSLTEACWFEVGARPDVTNWFGKCVVQVRGGCSRSRLDLSLEWWVGMSSNSNRRQGPPREASTPSRLGIQSR